MIFIKLFLAILTYCCDNRCRFCVSNHVSEAISQESVDRTIIVLPFHAIQDRIDRYALEEYDVFYFSGGEPTLHPHLADYIQYVNRYTKNIGLLTNGNRLSDKAYFNRLAAAGLSDILIPVYGYNESTHDFITQHKGSYHLLIQAFENIRKLKKEKRLILRIRFVISKTTYQSIQQICSLFPYIEIADEIIFSLIHPSYSARENNELVDIECFKEGFNKSLQILFRRMEPECNLRLLPEKGFKKLMDKQTIIQYLIRRETYKVVINSLKTAEQSIRIDLDPSTPEMEWYDLINN